MVLRREARDHFIDQRLVISQYFSLREAVIVEARDVEPRAAQPFKPRQDFHRRKHPGAESPFARAAKVVLALEERDVGRKMQFDAQIALEILGELPLKGAVGVKPRDLELVFGRHDLEEIARDRFRQLSRFAEARRLGLADLLDARAIALRVGGVLIVHEKFARAAR